MPNPKGIVLALDKVETNTHYEVQLKHQFGVNAETCNSESISMTFVRIPPGHRARAHIHMNAELAQYIIKGRGKYCFNTGITGEEEEYDIYPGCFIYVPRGCIHVIKNTGDEDIESVAAYNANSGPATGKIFVEGALE